MMCNTIIQQFPFLIIKKKQTNLSTKIISNNKFKIYFFDKSKRFRVLLFYFQ